MRVVHIDSVKRHQEDAPISSVQPLCLTVSDFQEDVKFYATSKEQFDEWYRVSTVLFSPFPDSSLTHTFQALEYLANPDIFLPLDFSGAESARSHAQEADQRPYLDSALLANPSRQTFRNPASIKSQYKTEHTSWSQSQLSAAGSVARRPVNPTIENLRNRSEPGKPRAASIRSNIAGSSNVLRDTSNLERERVDITHGGVPEPNPLPGHRSTPPQTLTPLPDTRPSPAIQTSLDTSHGVHVAALASATSPTSPVRSPVRIPWGPLKSDRSGAVRREGGGWFRQLGRNIFSLTKGKSPVPP